MDTTPLDSVTYVPVTCTRTHKLDHEYTRTHKRQQPATRTRTHTYNSLHCVYGVFELPVLLNIIILLNGAIILAGVFLSHLGNAVLSKQIFGVEHHTSLLWWSLLSLALIAVVVELCQIKYRGTQQVPYRIGLGVILLTTGFSMLTLMRHLSSQLHLILTLMFPQSYADMVADTTHYNCEEVVRQFDIIHPAGHMHIYRYTSVYLSGMALLVFILMTWLGACLYAALCVLCSHLCAKTTEELRDKQTLHRQDQLRVQLQI